MKKYFFLALAAASGLMLASCAKEYDDSALKQDITKLQDRVSALEQITKALQENDYVTTFKDNGDGSYTLTFAKSGDVTIRNGKDGVNGENGENGDSFFKSVNKDGEHVILVLNDNTEIKVPLHPVITSIEYIPTSVDETIQVSYEEGLPAGDITLEFIVTPESAASALTTENTELAAVYTKASFTTIPVASVKAAKNIIRVKVSGTALPLEFYNDAKSCAVTLQTTFGETKFNSGFIHLVPNKTATNAAIAAHGFADSTSVYGITPYADGIRVFQANTIKGIAKIEKATEGWDFVETPYTWVNNSQFGSPYQNFSQAYFWGLGQNLTPDKGWPTEDIECNATIVLISPEIYAAKVNYSNSVVANAGSYINVSGTPANLPTAIYDNGQYVKEEQFGIPHEDAEKNPLGITQIGSKSSRSSIGISNDGTIEFGISYFNEEKLRRTKDCIFWWDANAHEYSWAETVVWDVKQMVNVWPWTVRTGYASGMSGFYEAYPVNGLEIIQGDGSGWEPAIGACWNGKRARTFIGQTKSGLIGIATFEKVGTYTASIMLKDMGWINVAQLGTETIEDGIVGLAVNGYIPTIVINGKVVAGSETAEALYSFGFDKR